MATPPNPPQEDFEKLLAGLSRSFLAAYPGRLRAVYLLGSRAAGRDIPSSDIDLGLVFAGTLAPAQRDEVWSFARTLGGPGSLPLDLVLLDESDLRRGVRAHAKEGRLLAGDDVLKDCPLLPDRELIGYYAYSALYNHWLIRRKPDRLPTVARYPSPQGEFFGYEEVGIWTGGDRFLPGFALLVNLATSIGSFRLATQAAVFLPGKSAAAASYRGHLPDDPAAGAIEDIHRLCRERWAGAVPDDPADRRRISALCPAVLGLETGFLDACVRGLPDYLATEDSELRGRLGRFVPRLEPALPAHAEALERARAVLAGRPDAAR